MQFQQSRLDSISPHLPLILRNIERRILIKLYSIYCLALSPENSIHFVHQKSFGLFQMYEMQRLSNLWPYMVHEISHKTLYILPVTKVLYEDHGPFSFSFWPTARTRNLYMVPWWRSSILYSLVNTFKNGEQ